MAIRKGSTKLVANTQRQKGNFARYDLSEDIAETTNQRWKVSNKENQSMLDTWEAWNAQLKDRVFPTLGNDNWWER
jgi:hypothetical protein